MMTRFDTNESGVISPQGLPKDDPDIEFVKAILISAWGFDRGTEKTLREFDRVVGLDRLKVFHLNDSKTDLGSRVDRHEHIGKGKIGREAFRHIVNDAHFKNSPGCLETYKSEDLHEDAANLAVLRSLVK